MSGDMVKCDACGIDAPSDLVAACVSCGDFTCDACADRNGACPACEGCAECGEVVAHDDPHGTYVIESNADGSQTSFRVCSNECSLIFADSRDW